MKYFNTTLTLIAFFIINSLISAQWITVNPPPQTDTLNCVTLVSSTTGYAVGKNGTIIKTVDGGESWTLQNSGITTELNGVFFTDENNGVAVGVNGILKTNDGGNTWRTPDNTDGAAFLNSVAFGNNNTGLAVGTLGKLYKTTDGGENWKDIPVLVNTINDVEFLDENTAVVVCRSGLIYKSTDAGDTWTSLTSGTTSTLLGVAFSDMNTGITVGLGAMIGTSDGGDSWNSLSSTSFLDVDFLNNQTAIAVGFGGKVHRTTDAGASWETQTSGTELPLTSVSFFNENVGLAVGYDGVILRTENGGVTGIADNDDQNPTNFKLYQNYPNPFNPGTTIKFMISQTANVRLEIFNALGEKVSTLINEELTAGEHSIYFNASGLVSGIYFYALTSGNHKSVKKLTYLK